MDKRDTMGKGSKMLFQAREQDHIKREFQKLKEVMGPIFPKQVRMHA